MKSEPTDAAAELPQEGIPSWEEWLDTHGARLLLYARGQTRTEADAEDLLQTALVELVRAVESGRFRLSPAQWPAYVISCMRRDAMLLHRSVQRSRESAATVAAVLPLVQEDTPWLTCTQDAEIDRVKLEHALRTMRSDYAEIVILRVWEELSFREIADIIGVPLQTVFSRYQSAIRLLRQQLTPHFKDKS